MGVFDRAKQVTEKDVLKHQMGKSIQQYQLVLKKAKADYTIN